MGLATGSCEVEARSEEEAMMECALSYTHRPQDAGPSLGFRLARGLTSEEGPA